MTSDEIVRRAALLLRAGAVAVGAFVASLDEPTREAFDVAARQLRDDDRGTPAFKARRDERRARGDARPGSCVDQEKWGTWPNEPCVSCDFDPARMEGRDERPVARPGVCPCECPTCDLASARVSA